MRLAGRPRLTEFWRRHADARVQLEAWTAEVESAQWASPHELQRDFPQASFVGQGHVVFNIRRNRYRLHAVVNYDAGVVVVMRVGTHAEYDRWAF